MQFNADIEAKIKNLTVKQVNAAIEKHINPAKLFAAHAGDFDKK